MFKLFTGARAPAPSHPPAANSAAMEAPRAGTSGFIELRNVVKQYETAAGAYTALKGIDLSVGRGEFVAVVGKSGSGKSTLINMITGIDRPTSGAVEVAGTDLVRLDEGRLAEWRGRNLGIIFQFFQLLPTLTVAENVMLPMDFGDIGTARERRARAAALLGRMELSEQAGKLPAALSGGQQQRVAIARALANDPGLIIADEPTGNLDSRTAESIFRLFEDLVGQGKTVVMVTHDIDLARRAGRAVVVADGEILAKGLPHA
jgi:putative ABC transport system ATP-binding protein